MVDRRRVLTQMAKQMYDDMRFITQLNPIQIVDDETARMFNHLLNEARTVYRTTDQVFTFTEMSARVVKYKDALVVAGQLSSLLTLLTAGNVPIADAPPPGAATPAPAGTRPSSAAIGRPASPEIESIDIEPDQRDDPHDSELYGAAKPPRKNPDGTIPFSLG